MDKITSLQNPRVKMLMRLKNRRDREKMGLFLIEGYRECLRALTGGAKIKELYFCPKHFLGSNEDTLIDQICKSGAEKVYLEKNVFERVSYRDRPDGILAVANYLDIPSIDMLVSRATCPFFIAAEAIEKPGNLGTILRSSDAAGVDGLIVCDKCTDLFNPNVVRASVGTLFTVPLCEGSSHDIIQGLKNASIQIVAATPSAKENYTEVDLTGPICIAVGTEQHGLSKTWLEAADVQVRIPMKGVADSLNVASATTLLLYEVLRQRNGSSSR